MRGTLVGIVGPTATGKTDVGLELARGLGGEIISADSMAVYRGMDIGTAKPTPEDQAAAPFHLIDVVDPDEQFSVAEFKRLAGEAIDDILERGRLPLLVGGTGLYVKAVTSGMNIPAVLPDTELRQELKAEAERYGGEHILAKLREIDPQTAERLHPRDTKRIIRAIEVHSSTGVPLSELHRLAPSADVPYRVELYGLDAGRQELYNRIERRIDRQIEAGLVREVQDLLDRGYSRDLPAMKGLGYKQIAAYLAGECDLADAVELLKRDTRRFAKRQLTWFRADARIVWINTEGRSTVEIAAEITEGLKADLGEPEHRRPPQN